MKFQYEREAIAAANHAGNGFDYLPKRTTPVESLAFYVMVLLYSLYQHGVLDKDQGHEWKKIILAKFESATKDADSFKEETRRLSKFFQNVEMACSAYQKERTLDNADKIIKSIYHLQDI